MLLKVVEKKKIAHKVFLLKLKAKRKINFVPGQHVDVFITKKLKRAYSVFSSTYNDIEIIVNTKAGGPGSIFFEEITKETELKVSESKGRFTLRNSHNPKLFVATGSGLVPILSMLKELQKQRFSKKLTVLFGIKTKDDNFAKKFIKNFKSSLKLKFIYCISQDSKIPKGRAYFKGRVTDFIKNSDEDYSNYDIYISGNQGMVTDAEKLLMGRSARKIYTEKY